MDISERQLQILQAIISDVISTGEPVGSRTLSKNHDINVSPATIRNEMSDLEEMGYLTHTHTSAGRIPTDKAYRLYVDGMMQKYELPEQEKNIISSRLRDDFNEFEKTIKKAASLLSEITNLTSFAITPSQNEDVLKYINVLPVDEDTVVLMIVGGSGKVSNTALKLNCAYNEENLALLSKNLTYTFKGKTISEALKIDIIQNLQMDIEAMSGLAENIMPSFIKTLENMLDVNLYMDGLTNIFNIPEFNDIDRARTFLEMLNHKEDLTKVLVNRENGVIITIGNENAKDIMPDCSMITATYEIDGKLIGKIGVIGPTRMKYDEVTSVIEYMTKNLSDTFKLGGGE